MVTARALEAIDGDSGSVEPEKVVVKFRSASDGGEIQRPWLAAAAEDLQSAAPWRTFRWYKGQKHYSGIYWSATCAGHVIYESRLELSRLLLADFDRAVSWIVPQPVLLEAVVAGEHCRHVPDFLLITGAGPVVVDVKPARQAAKAVVARTFAWTRTVVEQRGWRYEVWCDADPVYLANVRFLAGYRQPQHVDPEVVDALLNSEIAGLSVGAVIDGECRWPSEFVRAALLHLLWRQLFTADLMRPLSRTHILELAG
ncbi:TnsA endonuclease N terminal protein [Mycobacteroides abscessus subsp. massiliense]|uniref:TnsA-like heteromeric transposase endonuclease subunit n=1 Tax=Mycobacteroides abscessus TaxID=36809 RepID=UPI00035F431A|nr:TnsA-like heteromeric transposase endonuclease subunit [Mycobacteroides abscessus]AMU33212.1 transposase [Mycobacteroides abscessus]AMU77719.1 transposase [Mycobacteroides abscessus]ANO01377.1 transposase [Mycobacteroides abscessus]ANO26666.1 transposase [Mycobacteroides abscessus]MDO3031638.1 TnsA-like heteromeric transposase endonuclease subunit [Mycobacteroides abscessus subsp. massiliense]